MSAALGAGSDKIEGAFGRMLGEMFNPASALRQASLTDGTPMLRFKPDKPFRSFSNYFVLVTPKTHVVYSIWGIGKVANTEAGKKEQALVMQLLSDKYGPEDKPAPMDALGDVKHISQGTRYVYTKITGFSDVTLEIRYYDTDLEKQAEQERLEIEAKKVDSSGL